MTSQKNIMTVDLEDYYCDLKFDEWGKYESRIEETTNILLKLFEKYNITATFFTVGYIAEKFPEIIEQIIKKGHEVGSHSYSHLDIRKSNPKEFEIDLKKSISTLEKISGQKIKGFRAPFFSINEETEWAFNIIKKYFKYDSSIFPVRTPLYGIPKALRFTYNPSKNNMLIHDKSENFIEIPPSTIHFPILGNIPIAGGFYLRFLPYWIIKKGIKNINKNNFAMCYIHPKDIDKNMPKISQYSWYYYYGLKNSIKKYEKLLRSFKFDSVENILKI